MVKEQSESVRRPTQVLVLVPRQFFDALEFDLSQGDDPPVRQRRRLCVLGTQATVVDSVDLIVDDSGQEHPEHVQISETCRFQSQKRHSVCARWRQSGLSRGGGGTHTESVAARASMQFLEGEFLTTVCVIGPSGFPQGCLQICDEVCIGGSRCRT